MFVPGISASGTATRPSDCTPYRASTSPETAASEENGDVFVLPSIDRCEAFGIAQLEAMACGKPVVSSDLPTGVRFVNRDGVTGLLCPPGDSDALAAALTRLLDDGALRARMGKDALRRVEQEFSATRMIDRTLEVYESVRSGR